MLRHYSIYGDNESMLCKWFKRTGKRDDIFLASKFGLFVEKYKFKGIDSSAENCKQACQTSLKKLGIDCIDLCKCFESICVGLHLDSWY